MLRNLDRSQADLLAAMNAVGDLAQLPQDWDSYGSRQIQTSAIRQALEILQMANLQHIPMPFVVPVPGGGVQLEWRLEGRELELEVQPDRTIAYLRVDENDIDEEGVVPKDQPSAILEHIQWVAAQTTTEAPF